MQENAAAVSDDEDLWQPEFLKCRLSYRYAATANEKNFNRVKKNKLLSSALLVHTGWHEIKWNFRKMLVAALFFRVKRFNWYQKMRSYMTLQMSYCTPF